ncbi:MAG TPA: YibE/F family protein [Pseudogracilibacillus sp.]|nr:YibE/F family protein [Pseudogracilibacillus sp.]
MKHQKKKNLQSILKLSFFASLVILSIVFVFHNAFLYDRPIVKIIDSSITETEKVVDQYGNEDRISTQILTGIVQNGKQKGRNVALTNQYSYSGAYDEAYQVGNEVFVSFHKNTVEAELMTGDITGVKRDKYTIIIAWLFIIVLLLIGKKQGLYTSISLGLNIILLSYALDLYVQYGFNLIWVSILLTLLFTAISLLLTNGWNEKSYTAIIATIIGTLLSVGITVFVMWLTAEEGLRYEEMQFLTRPYKLIFIAGLLIGSLGAVMDVAISISTAMFELYETNKNISIQQLKQSGFNIGKDIMGTMTNILLFAYVSGSIPILIVYLMNHSPLDFALSINLSLELTRALAGGIGIVITIPIGLYISIFFIHRKEDKL